MIIHYCDMTCRQGVQEGKRLRKMSEPLKHLLHNQGVPGSVVLKVFQHNLKPQSEIWFTETVLKHILFTDMSLIS